MRGYRFQMEVDNMGGDSRRVLVYQANEPAGKGQGMGPASDAVEVEIPDSIAPEFASNGKSMPAQAVVVDADTGEMIKRYDDER